MTVRTAILEDRPQILHLLELMWEETGIFSLSFDKVESHIDQALVEKPNQKAWIGVIGDDILEALIILSLASPWYSDEMYLVDTANFVAPDYRRSGHAQALIEYAKFMVDAIRETNPSFRLMLGINSSKRTAGKIRLFSRQLSDPIGALFAYPPITEAEPLKSALRTG